MKMRGHERGWRKTCECRMAVTALLDVDSDMMDDMPYGVCVLFG